MGYASYLVLTTMSQYACLSDKNVLFNRLIMKNSGASANQPSREYNGDTINNICIYIEIWSYVQT
jgi:hypothetical protein